MGSWNKTIRSEGEKDAGWRGDHQPGGLFHLFVKGIDIRVSSRCVVVTEVSELPVKGLPLIDRTRGRCTGLTVWK